MLFVPYPGANNMFSHCELRGKATPRVFLFAHRPSESMPEVVVNAVSGRSADQKKRLMERITEAVVEEFNVPKESVVVQISETMRENKMKGGVLYSER